MTRPPARDAVLAAVLAVVVLGGTVLAATAQPAAPVGVVTVVAVVVASGACAWRRDAPMVVAVVVTFVVAGYVLAGQPYGPIQLLVALAGAEVARRRPARQAVVLAVGAAMVLAAALSTRLQGSGVIATGTVLVAWPAVFVVIPVLVGALVRARGLAAAREREELVARGAAEEQLRVAREVHDVAGHGFAVVAMQAGVALTVFDDDPAQARISLEAVRDTAAHALDDLHRTLDAVRAEPRDLDALVDGVRAAGVPIDLRVDGDPEALGEAVAVGVHRVVQEALTNVVRHAGPTTATVAVTCGRRDVEVAVRDRGAGPSGECGGGSGLAGLQARVEALGGSLRAGGRPTGGFEVVARFPGDTR